MVDRWCDWGLRGQWQAVRWLVARIHWTAGAEWLSRIVTKVADIGGLV